MVSSIFSPFIRVYFKKIVKISNPFNFGDVWIIFPILFFKILLVHNHFYTSFTLRVCDDHSYILPYRRDLLSRIFQFIREWYTGS